MCQHLRLAEIVTDAIGPVFVFVLQPLQIQQGHVFVLSKTREGLMG